MKKSALIAASVLLAFTGCGRGWFPLLHRGGSCLNQGCTSYNVPSHATPVSTLANADCVDCESDVVSSGYESYDNYGQGVVYDSGAMHTGNQIYGSANGTGIPIEGSVITKP